MINIEDFLKSQEIQYVLHEHPAVYTCEEAEKYCSNIPGLACKNLLLKGRKSGRYFLMILPAKKRADFKKIGEIIGDKQITFASAKDLLEKLSLEPGAVSPFGLLNDQKKEVEVCIDKDVYNADRVSFHPNRNTASLELSGEMFRKFSQVIEHEIRVVDVQ